MRKLLAFASSCALGSVLLAEPAHGDCEIDVSDYVGWTIVHAGTITGYIDPDGEESDEYEGCEYGRVLIVDYSMGVTCADYTYSYAYYPDIVILSDGRSAVACIEDEEIDITLQ